MTVPSSVPWRTLKLSPVATPGQLAHLPLTFLEYLTWPVAVPAPGTVTI